MGKKKKNRYVYTYEERMEDRLFRALYATSSFFLYERADGEPLGVGCFEEDCPGVVRVD